MSGQGDYAGLANRYMPSGGGTFDAFCFDQRGNRREAPNPCRKFHISSDQASAVRLAHGILPLLRDINVFHKVVRFENIAEWFTNTLTTDPMPPGQMGKFITVYAPNTRDAWDVMVGEVATTLRVLRHSQNLNPHRYPIVQRAGAHSGHREWEVPGSGGLLFGGFETNPSK